MWIRYPVWSWREWRYTYLVTHNVERDEALRRVGWAREETTDAE
jgi:hypothetical protein